MGWKYEVSTWDSAFGSERFYWLQIYAGDNLFKAIYYMIWAKRQGWKCIKLEYRP